MERINRLLEEFEFASKSLVPGGFDYSHRILQGKSLFKEMSFILNRKSTPGRISGDGSGERLGGWNSLLGEE